MKILWVMAAGLLLALAAFLLFRTKPASNGGAHLEEPASREPPTGAAGLAASVRALAYRYAGRGREAAGWGLRARVVDLGGMPRGVRALAVLGYASVAVLLAAVLLVDLFDGVMPSVRYEIAANELVLVPFPAMVVASLGFVVGWALLLTGASDCRRRVFLPMVGLFLLQMFLLSSAAATGSGTLVMRGLALALVAVPVGVHFFAPRLSHWRDFAVVEFLFWAAMIFVFVACAWAIGETRADVADALDTMFALLLLLSEPFWLLLALDVVDLAVDLSRPAVLRLGRSLSGRVLNALAVLALLAQPVFGLALVAVGEVWGEWILIAWVPLAVAALALARRWTVRTAATLMALVLVSLVFTLGVSLASVGNDFTGLALSATGLIPPAVLFAGLVAYDVFNFGARFASTDGRVMPRTGRTLMYFGTAVLVLSSTLLYLNIKPVVEGEYTNFLQEFVNDFFFVGTLFLGPPYLIWIAWKRRERLIGEAFAPLTHEQDQQATTEYRQDTSVHRRSSNTSRAGSSSRSRVHTPNFTAASWLAMGVVSALVALFFLPAVFGASAVFFGYLAKRQGSDIGGVAVMVVGVVCLMLGVVIEW